MEKPKFQSVQSLRFFAAGLVLLYHLEFRLAASSERYGQPYHPVGFYGLFGVDIFFVISGFIMAWLAWDRFGKIGAPRQFVNDRITRIVPLYWLFTSFALLMVYASGHMGDHAVTRPTALQVVESYVFWPHLNFEGLHRPVLGLGWTLDYEMLFYVILAGCLFLKRSAGLITLFSAFLIVFLAGQVPNVWEAVRIWSDPIIFEFLGGVGLALIRIRFGALVPVRAHPLLLMIPIVVLTWLGNDRQGAWQWANWIVALGLVAFAVLGNDQGQDAISRATSRMGDWSYSLYLVHSFVITIVGSLWNRFFGGSMLYVFAAVIVTSSLVLSWGSFAFVEKPLMRWLRRGAMASLSATSNADQSAIK